MSDLRRWTGPVDPEGFQFGERRAPLVVTVTRVIVRPSEDGPVEVGRTVSRHVDGRLVERVAHV